MSWCQEPRRYMSTSAMSHFYPCIAAKCPGAAHQQRGCWLHPLRDDLPHRRLHTLTHAHSPPWRSGLRATKAGWLRCFGQFRGLDGGPTAPEHFVHSHFLGSAKWSTLKKEQAVSQGSATKSAQKSPRLDSVQSKRHPLLVEPGLHGRESPVTSKADSLFFKGTVASAHVGSKVRCKRHEPTRNNWTPSNFKGCAAVSAGH